MTALAAFNIAYAVLALRRVYASLATVAFLNDERFEVNAAFGAREAHLLSLLDNLEPVLQSVIDAKLQGGAPPIRPGTVNRQRGSAITVQLLDERIVDEAVIVDVSFRVH